MAPKKQQSRSRQARFERGAPRRERQKRILIVCEGKQTEPSYLRGLCRAHRLTATEVVPAGEPKGLLRSAKRRTEAARNEGDPYDEVWCVMDVDKHDHLDPACLEIERLPRFNAAVSCPNFEVWLLLHVRFSTAAMTRKEAKDEATADVPAYGSDDTYAPLAALLDTAFANVERLRQHHATASSGSHPNPSTDVDRLVRRLLALAERYARR